MPLLPRLYTLAPAPPRPQPEAEPNVTFLDLPAELRVEIYKLALESVTVHIVPQNCEEARRSPHALTLTSRRIRNEVLPLMHALCPIQSSITDFNFDSLKHWIDRIPPDQQANLCKNTSLSINFMTTTSPPRTIDSMRKWLHMRADKYRPQPNWHYTGSRPDEKVCKDLLRRAKRMKEPARQQELFVILRAIGVQHDANSGRTRAGNS